VLVEDLPDLPLVGGGVGDDLVFGERRAGGVLAGGVADAGGEVADEEDDLVAELLELPQLVDDDGVAEVEVGRGRIAAELDDERAVFGAALFELLLELVADLEVHDAAADDFKLFVDGGKGHGDLGGPP
jgi:hypothetical protein